MSPSHHLTRRIRRRTDLYLLPFLSLLFMLNSLDRSNVGNAETAGFTKHAGLQKRDLNDAVAAFFAVFVVLQPLGAALGKRVGVSKWVGGVMVCPPSCVTFPELRCIGWLGGLDGVDCVCRVEGTVDLLADLHRRSRRYVSRERDCTILMWNHSGILPNDCVLPFTVLHAL